MVSVSTPTHSVHLWMVEWLRVHAALPEDSRSLPSVQSMLGSSQPLRTLAPGDPLLSSVFCQHGIACGAHPHSHTRKGQNNKQEI